MPRTATALLGLLLLSATAGCSMLGGGQTPEPRGCGKCQAETQQVRTEVAKIPEIVRIDRLQYTPGQSIEVFPTLTLDLRIKADSVDAVRVAVVKAAWRSNVTPLDNVNINMKGPDGKLVSQEYSFATDKDRQPYLNAWGPRPSN